MLDNAPINAMNCDAKSFKITYVNQTSKDTLNSIQDLLPNGVNGNNIIGTCIEVFHKDPAHQRQMLASSSIYP